MPACVLLRSVGGKGNKASRTAPTPFRSECPFPIRLPESGVRPDGEQQRESDRKNGRAGDGRPTNSRESLSRRPVRATGASAGGGRPGLSRRSRADRREPTCSRLTFEVGIRLCWLSTGEDLSRPFAFLRGCPTPDYFKSCGFSRYDLPSDLWRDRH